LITTLQSIGIEGTYLKVLKAIYENTTANVVLNGERLGAFPLGSGAGQGCPHSPVLFGIVLEVLVKAISQEKETKSNQIGKKKVKLPCLCRNPEESTKKKKPC